MRDSVEGGGHRPNAERRRDGVWEAALDGSHVSSGNRCRGFIMTRSENIHMPRPEVVLLERTIWEAEKVYLDVDLGV